MTFAVGEPDIRYPARLIEERKLGCVGGTRPRTFGRRSGNSRLLVRPADSKIGAVTIEAECGDKRGNQNRSYADDPSRPATIGVSHHWFAHGLRRISDRNRLLTAQARDQWQDRPLKNFRRERADLLEGDATLAIDDVRLGNAVDAPIDRHASVTIGAGARVGIAHRVEPARGVVGLVLVVEPVDWNDPLRSQTHEQRMLFTAGDAP